MRRQLPCGEYRLLQKLGPFMNFKESKTWPVGVGDDAAIRNSAAGERLILTADTFVENVHFSCAYMSFREIGRKAMDVNLSDCAAMGALPDGALVQAVFPQTASPEEIRRALCGIYEGFSGALKQWRFPIVGGNLSRGPCWMLAVTLIGKVNAGGRLLLRKGARKGDYLWVTGAPGESAAGLAAIKKWGGIRNVPRRHARLARVHLSASPRIKEGRELAADPLVHAMIDVSDGLSKECRTLSFENNMGIVLDGKVLEDAGTLRELAAELGVDAREWVLGGGEDYELLFAASPRFRPQTPPPAGSVRLTRIGKFTDEVNGVRILRGGGHLEQVKETGWDHLEKPARPGRL